MDLQVCYSPYGNKQSQSKNEYNIIGGISVRYVVGVVPINLLVKYGAPKRAATPSKMV